MQDERCNRVSSVLIGLGTVMCVSPVCEKKAVFAVCQMIKEKHIEINLVIQVNRGSHRLEKYLNLEGFLEKSLKIKSALKGTGKSLKSLEELLNSTIFCRT